ncbi:MAG TPA: CpaF family protein [Alphaproteobacteria bacterium]|nr:CpaF family protein [Alphaproteobacteria bacterium]
MFGRKPPSVEKPEAPVANSAKALPTPPADIAPAPDAAAPERDGSEVAQLAQDIIRERLFKSIDPGAALRMPRNRLRAEVVRKVSEIASESRLQLNEKEQTAIANDLLDDMVGVGPIEPLLNDPAVTDILVNGPHKIFCERNGRIELTGLKFRDEAHVVNVAQRIAASVGRRVDESSPMVDARLQDGSRVNVIVPPLALDGASISIRRFNTRGVTLDWMANSQNLSHSMARVLEIAAASRLNILVSGGTGSGKTTLLNALSRNIGHGERVITIEDAAELALQQPHVVRLETRPPNIEGTGEVTQRDLVKNALRMRPDRIIIGECRGAEAFDMLQAMNTGHAGSMSTVHANNPRDALIRLENMVMMATANLPSKAIRQQIVSAVDLIVQTERMRDGKRRIIQVSEVVGLESDVIVMQDLFEFHTTGESRDGGLQGEFRYTGARPDFWDRAAYYGYESALRTALS